MPTSNLLCAALSRSCASSRAVADGLHALEAALHGQRRVGDVGRDLQLQRLQVRLRLLERQLRARDGGLLRALAERIREGEPDGANCGTSKPKMFRSASK